MATTLETIVNKIAEKEASLAEVTAPAKALRFEGDAIRAGDGQISLDHAGSVRFCQLVGAPTHYLRKLSPQLKESILQYHIDHSDAEWPEVALITRENRLVGLRGAGLVHLRGAETINAVVDVGHVSSTRSDCRRGLAM